MERSPGQCIVRVIGRLTQDQVPDLLKLCAESDESVVTVDLTDLVSADAVGLHALRCVRAGGARLANVPRYIESVLGTELARHPRLARPGKSSSAGRG